MIRTPIRAPQANAYVERFVGTIRRDVFRISRVETTVAKDGSMSTRAELDNGTNLLEVLQARLQTSVGLGASYG